MAKKSEKSGKSELTSIADVLNEYGIDRPTTFVDTGIDTLNDILGGGIARGSSYAMWGVAGCGKSTIAAQTLRSFCRQGLKCVLVDTERAWNDLQLQSFGLWEYKESGLLIHLTVRDYAQLEDVCKVISSDQDAGISFAVFDSMSELEAYADKTLTVKDCRPGIKALQASFLLPRIKNWFADADIASLWLFHARANLQMGVPNPYASKDRQDGGYAALHVPDAIIKLSVGFKLKEKEGDTEEVYGVELFMEATKNKFSKPFRQKKVKLIFGQGVSKRYATIDEAVASGVIRKSGASYSLPWGEKFFGVKKLYAMEHTTLKRLYEYLRTNGASEVGTSPGIPVYVDPAVNPSDLDPETGELLSSEGSISNL